MSLWPFGVEERRKRGERKRRFGLCFVFNVWELRRENGKVGEMEELGVVERLEDEEEIGKKEKKRNGWICKEMGL